MHVFVEFSFRLCVFLNCYSLVILFILTLEEFYLFFRDFVLLLKSVKNLNAIIDFSFITNVSECRKMHL